MTTNDVVTNDVVTSDATTGSGTSPRGKLHGVAPYVRHMWHVLYRATRRHSVRIDELLTRLDRAETQLTELRGARGEHLRRQVQLTARIVDLEELSGLLTRDVQELAGRIHLLERQLRGEGLP